METSHFNVLLQYNHVRNEKMSQLLYSLYDNNNNNNNNLYFAYHYAAIGSI